MFYLWKKCIHKILYRNTFKVLKAKRALLKRNFSKLSTETKCLFSFSPIPNLQLMLPIYVNFTFGLVCAEYSRKNANFAHSHTIQIYAFYVQVVIIKLFFFKGGVKGDVWRYFMLVWIEIFHHSMTKYVFNNQRCCHRRVTEGLQLCLCPLFYRGGVPVLPPLIFYYSAKPIL